LPPPPPLRADSPSVSPTILHRIFLRFVFFSSSRAASIFSPAAALSLMRFHCAADIQATRRRQDDMILYDELTEAFVRLIEYFSHAFSSPG